MKKIVLLALVSLATVMSYAQKVATTSVESLQKGKSSGSYVFSMPADVTAAEVDGVKNYYKQYFTVVMDDKKHELTVSLIKNDEMSTRVINRLMTSLEVRDFNVAGKEMSFDDMFDQYLK